MNQVNCTICQSSFDVITNEVNHCPHCKAEIEWQEVRLFSSSVWEPTFNKVENFDITDCGRPSFLSNQFPENNRQPKDVWITETFYYTSDQELARQFCEKHDYELRAVDEIKLNVILWDNRIDYCFLGRYIESDAEYQNCYAGKEINGGNIFDYLTIGSSEIEGEYPIVIDTDRIKRLLSIEVALAMKEECLLKNDCGQFLVGVNKNGEIFHLMKSCKTTTSN